MDGKDLGQLVGRLTGRRESGVVRVSGSMALLFAGRSQRLGVKAAGKNGHGNGTLE